MEEHEFYPMFAGNHCTRPWFRGTFACDEIGQETASPGLYVVNTAPRSSFGEHWVLFYVCPKDNAISYFDSFGMIPIHEEFYDFIGGAASFFYSKKRIQGTLSHTCGLYCLYVGALLCCGVPLRECIKTFSASDYRRNDTHISILVRKQFSSPALKLSCCSAL
ncbi:hypothetical protein ISCGN_031350 [Ixodes scapularis]